MQMITMLLQVCVEKMESERKLSFNYFLDSEKLLGVFDFGDLTYTCTIFEIAIAMAYAMMPTK